MRFSIWLLLAGLQLAGAQPQISLSGSAVRGGQTATVTVTLSAAAGNNVSAVQFFVSAPVSYVITATPGAAVTAASKTLTCSRNTAGAGDVYGCVVSGGVNALADGPLAVLRVVTVPGAAVSLALTKLLGTNPAGDSPGIAVLASAPLLVSLSACDINGDGITDLKDAQNLMDQINGVILPATADLNGDAKTDVIDLQRVVNTIAGAACRLGV